MPFKLNPIPIPPSSQLSRRLGNNTYAIDVDVRAEQRVSYGSNQDHDRILSEPFCFAQRLISAPPRNQMAAHASCVSLQCTRQNPSCALTAGERWCCFAPECWHLCTSGLEQRLATPSCGANHSERGGISSTRIFKQSPFRSFFQLLSLVARASRYKSRVQGYV